MARRPGVADVVPFPSCRRGAPFPISCIYDRRFAVFLALHMLLLLVLLRFLLRRQWLAAVVFLLIVPVMVGRDFNLLPWGPLSALLAGLVILLVLLRFGVLALIACLCCDMMLQGVPLSPNLSAWYAHATLVPLGFVAAITCYGLYAATYGRSICHDRIDTVLEVATRRRSTISFLTAKLVDSARTDRAHRARRDSRRDTDRDQAAGRSSTTGRCLRPDLKLT